MKVALIHYRLVHRGGLETRLLNYIRYFSERGDEIHVIVAKYDPGIPLPENVTLHHLSPGWWPKPFRQGAFNNKLETFMQEHSFDLRLSLGRTTHQDAVIVPGVHAAYHRAMKKRFHGLSDQLQMQLDLKTYKETPVLLAASEMIREELNQYYPEVPDEKISVLRPPVDTSRFNREFDVEEEQLWERFHVDPHLFTFLFVSTGHRMKNFSLLLKLFKALEEWPVELLIAGTKPRKLTSNMKYLGYVRDPEALYHAVDCTILPSLYEPYGQVVNESLCSGTPVIVSNRVGAKEVVDNTSGLVVSSFYLEDWVRAIDEVLNRTFYINLKFADWFKLTIEHHMSRILQLTGHEDGNSPESGS